MQACAYIMLGPVYITATWPCPPSASNRLMPSDHLPASTWRADLPDKPKTLNNLNSQCGGTIQWKNHGFEDQVDWASVLFRPLVSQGTVGKSLILSQGPPQLEPWQAPVRCKWAHLMHTACLVNDSLQSPDPSLTSLTPPLFVFLWLISLSIVSSRFIHIGK